MFCGGAVAYGEAKELSNAVFHCWYPGEFGGKAIAELIFGEYSPSGKLPVTFYSSTDELPAFGDYSMNNRTYRYYKGTPEFPFGFGLSYTEFDYGELKKEANGNEVRVSVTVKNIGDFNITELVLLGCFVPVIVPLNVREHQNLTSFEDSHLENGRLAFASSSQPHEVGE